MKNPSEPKFRKINAENENFKNRVGNIAGGKTLLKECGFEEKESFLEMADNADALLAFWDGVSRGTKHMIDLATSRKLPTIVIKYHRPPESRLACIGEDHMAFNFSWIEGDFRVFNFKKVPNE